MIATSATGRDHSHCVGHGGSPSGFSLVELLVVLMIMVMMAGLLPLAVERMIPGRRLAATAQQLATTLRELQSIALTTGKAVSLAAAQSSYATRDGNGTEKVVELPANMTLRLQDDVGGRVLTHLSFFPDGSSTGGRFEIRYGNASRNVSVTRLLGRVHEDR